GDVDVQAGADRSTGGGKNSVTSGAAVPATCRPAAVRRGPWMSRSPHALPAPEYRLAPRVGSIPTPRVVMPAGVPWRQGMLCGDGIASVKFSLPEQLPRWERGPRWEAASGVYSCYGVGGG